MGKTGQFNKRMHLAYKFKFQYSNYQLAQTSYTSSYCLLVPSIIVALTTETVQPKDTSEFLVDLLSYNSFVLLKLISFKLSLLLIHVRYSLYTLNLYIAKKVAPSNQGNNTGFFEELFYHYYMEKLPFCVLIKHIFKTFAKG